MNAHAPVSNPFAHLALSYAARGWPVFPCNPLTKKPITENGFYDATTDPATIMKWWAESPNAMIGCPTGPISGFWVLDADRDKTEGIDGVAVLAQLGDLPDTVEQVTPRGGQHKFFRWSPNQEVRNSASKFGKRVGKGIDVRGVGGYVILAGSMRADRATYEWTISPENGEIKEAPEWVYDELRRVRPAPVDTSAIESPLAVEAVSVGAAKVFNEQCRIVAAAEPGGRNDVLNRAAFAIGLFVAKGEISAERATEGLLRAADMCGLVDDDGEESAQKTIASGLGGGKRATAESDPTRFHEEVPPPPPAPAWSQPATVFAGKDVPPQRWLAGEMVPARTVTLLYGDGGTGKSLVSLQLALGVAATGKWLGMDVTRGAALFVTAEDEPEEVHRRIVAVAQGSGFELSDLGDLHWRSLSGQDAVLAAPNVKGLMEATKLFAALRAEIARVRPALLVLDTLADLFGGDEVKRIHARQFIQLLQSLLVDLPWDMSIILLAHPSVAGMNSGTGTSGSTAWSNSVRSRLYLERKMVKRGEKEMVEVDPDIRILSTKKANRTKQGGEVVVRWSAGRFIEQAAVAPSRDPDADALDEKTFLDLLDEFGEDRPVSPNNVSPSYAPKAFETDPRGEEIGRARLASAMARLFSQKSISIAAYGPPAKRYKRVVRASSDLFG